MSECVIISLPFLSEQQSPAGENVPLKHQLLRVIVRVVQYRMILTGETLLHQGLPSKKSTSQAHEQCFLSPPSYRLSE